METEVNFFWRGKNFGFLENLVLKSHIKVGHKPVVWLSGDRPKTKYWKEIEPKIELKDVNEVKSSVDKFLDDGGKPIIASDLWRFNFLYQYGGLYCDIDAFALKKFPNDEWILCSGEKNPTLLSIGVIKVPPKQEIFLDCLLKFHKEWGNVKEFSEIYKQHFGNTNPTHESRLFYPYKWNEWETLFEKRAIPKDIFSIHFYGHMLRTNLNFSRFSKKNWKNPKLLRLNEINKKWCAKNPETLLGRLWSLLQEK